VSSRRLSPTRPSPLGFDVPGREEHGDIADSLLDTARRKFSQPTESLTPHNVAMVAAERISSMGQVIQEQASRLNEATDSERTKILRTAIRWGAVAAMFITFLVVMSLTH
jgi:hypothetical protein